MTRLYIGAGVVLIGIILLTSWTVWNRKDATNNLLSKIEEINNDLSDKAISARDGHRLCVAAGGVWGFTDVRCYQNNQ